MLDAGTATIHLLLASLEARAWFEYVESDANWSDGASRLLGADPWAKANGFTVETGSVPSWPWLAQGSHRIKYVEQMLATDYRNNGGKRQELRWDERNPGSGSALHAHFAT